MNMEVNGGTKDFISIGQLGIGRYQEDYIKVANIIRLYKNEYGREQGCDYYGNSNYVPTYFVIMTDGQKIEITKDTFDKIKKILI